MLTQLSMNITSLFLCKKKKRNKKKSIDEVWSDLVTAFLIKFRNVFYKLYYIVIKNGTHFRNHWIRHKLPSFILKTIKLHY